ncbi:MAG: ribosomal-processing cysteine protease Prp, partial [Anaeroplasmataceae bacterium]
MIKYNTIIKNDNCTLNVIGHANYANHGNDIVCSSVSTALILSINLIEKLNLSYNITNLVCEEGNF